MQNPILFKLTKNNNINSWQIIVDGNTYYTIEGVVNGQLTTSLPTLCHEKNISRSNYRDANTQAFYEAKAKWDAKIHSGYHISIDNIHSSVRFEPMLAQTYDKLTQKQKISLQHEMIYSQPKLDGIRALAMIDVDGNVLLLSRNGKLLYPNARIINDIKDGLSKYPSIILDGELYCQHANFNEIIGMVRSGGGEGEPDDGLKYHIYDIYDKQNPHALFQIRYNMIKQMVEHLSPRSFSFVPTTKIAFSDSTTIDILEEDYIKHGYEGQMIRLDRPYTQGRTWSLIKRKRFEDDEFEIVQIFDGNGNRGGSIGSIQLKTKHGDLFNSNIKLDHARLAKLSNQRDELIGKLATVKYFHLTPAGIPRFPYIIKIDRTDFE